MKSGNSPWEIEFSSPSGEAVDGSPIGNGGIGAMVEAHQLNFSLHLTRHNIWHNFKTGHPKPGSFFPAKDFDTIKKLVQAEKFEKINEHFRKATAKGEPKYMLLPAAMMQIQPEESEIELAYWSRKLNMKTAAVDIKYKTRQRQAANRFIASIDYDVIAVEMKCNTRQLPYRVKVILAPKQMLKGVQTKFTADQRSKSIYMQVKGSGGLDYVVGIRADGPHVKVTANNHQAFLTVESKERSNTTHLYTAISSHLDGLDPFKETQKRLATAAKEGFVAIYKKHAAHWRAFWNRAKISLPDSLVQRQHNLGMYLLASSSQPGHQSPGLQGLWSYKQHGSGWNDYTNNFNSQAYFWPAYTGNQLQLAQPYYQTFKNMLPQLRRDTKKYYKARGVAYPLTTSPQGHAMSSYVTHYHTAGNSAFVAQNYLWQYRYTLDKVFLKQTAYPVMKECSLFYLDRIDIVNGKAVINASTSPEEGEGSYEAWGINPTMDIALIKELLESTIESARLLECDGELREAWQCLLEKMPDYPIKNGYLIEMQGREFKDSYRHAAVLTPIWPCEELTHISRPGDRRLAEASFERYLNKGRWCWAGYTYPWVALIAARLGQGNRAAGFLTEFIGVGCLRCGGLHMNADFSGSLKMATGKKNFTLEGNTMYSAAVFEMLLQSHNDVIQIFPALPDGWKEVSFENLRARGAFLVSAQRKSGFTKEIKIKSLAGVPCRILNPFRGRRILVKKCSSGRNVKVDIAVKGRFITFETSKNSQYIVSAT
jgi:alpha-L-fucosidase 2